MYNIGGTKADDRKKLHFHFKPHIYIVLLDSYKVELQILLFSCRVSISFSSLMWHSQIYKYKSVQLLFLQYIVFVLMILTISSLLQSEMISE